MRITRTQVVALLATLLGGVALLVAPASSSPFATGTLDVHGSLNMVSSDAPCPPNIPAASTACHTRTATGQFSGLGYVTHTYMYNGGYAPCGGLVIGEGDVKILGYTTTFKVAGKGEIDFTVADAPTCMPPSEAALAVTQSFTVTGGRGIYAGASGSGRIERTARYMGAGSRGVDTWIGTLVVPGLEFDVTPPTLTGATSKTVRAVRAPKGAKSVRVTYKVTGSDNAGGEVQVICAPRSGSRFPIGRTTVKCTASDSSGNTANAAFRVTVTRTR